MRVRFGIGAAIGALFIAVPALAQEPLETPAATAGPATDDAAAEPVEPAVEPAEPAEPADTYAAAPVVEAPEASTVEEGEQSGFEVAVRVAYGLPLGKLSGDRDDIPGDDSVKLKEAIKGMIPLQLDAGYRFNNHLFLGAYGSYGIGFEGDACDLAGAECDSPSHVRVGGEIIYNITPVTSVVSPWIGAGIGWEWLFTGGGQVVDVGGNTERVDVDNTASGLEIFNAQLGVDFRLADAVRLGPYALFSLGRYSNFSTNGDSDDDFESGTHEWLHFGVKATFGAFGGSHSSNRAATGADVRY